MNLRQLLISSGSLIILVIAIFIVKAAVLHGPVVELQSAPPLTGVIAQSLGTSGSNRSLPVAGKDFILQNTRYFDNQSWVVTLVAPIRSNADRATVILRNNHGLYQVVLGPGTAFPSSSLQSLPGDVSQYLLNKGLVYESSN